MTYSEKIKHIIKTYGIKERFLCDKLEISRHLLKKNIENDTFKTYQKNIIDKIENGLIDL